MYLRVSFIQKVTWILVAVLIAIIISASVLFSKQMVYLIRKLQSSMKRLENGNYELIEETVGNDELGSLVKSYNHMVGKMEALLEEIYQAGVRQKNAQFLALRTQINPHFLFNTLESIRIKAILNGDDDVADMVKILAKMFRNVLDSDKKNYTVNDELDNIRSYICLQNIRFDNVITLHEDVDRKLCQARIMPILFQPVIENSFKYGSIPKPMPALKQYIVSLWSATAEGVVPVPYEHISHTFFPLTMYPFPDSRNSSSPNHLFSVLALTILNILVISINISVNNISTFFFFSFIPFTTFLSFIIILFYIFFQCKSITVFAYYSIMF